jgi:inner membrane protein
MGTSLVESIGRLTRSPGFKFFMIAVLILLISIPLALVWFLVSERETKANIAKGEIAQRFGQAQQIIGPLLVVPYTVKLSQLQGDKTVETVQERYAVFLPDEFTAVGDTKSEVRRRAIYEVTLYTAKLKLSGRFPAPDIRLVDPEADKVRWRDAFLSIALGDVTGLKETSSLNIDGRPVSLEPGPGLGVTPAPGATYEPYRKLHFEPSMGIANSTVPGLHTRLFPIDAAVDQAPPSFAFETELSFNGSSSLTIAPIGRETNISLSSDWPHPSFTGAFLPDRREIGGDGFKASWKIPHLARSVPQAWRADVNMAGYLHSQLTQTVSGVNFYVPIDFYDLVNRGLKYSLMFLCVGFFGVFVLELTSGRSVHPVQYVFVGLALILFYVLLLSLSEHIGFTMAYLVASAATGGMLSLYVGRSLQSAARGYIMLFVFLILYGLLYLILRLEDYALLAGAVAGFVMLTVTMFATLRINWSGEAQPTAG